MAPHRRPRSRPPHSGTHRWPAATSGRPRIARLCDVRAQCAQAGRAHPRTQTVRARRAGTAAQAESSTKEADQGRTSRCHGDRMASHSAASLRMHRSPPTSLRGLVSSSSARPVMVCIECGFGCEGWKGSAESEWSRALLGPR
ncbi:hypothetical protein PsYK624_053750 [Phanerochaete sordida]|uniref:Uncharacterized protein n=1 Tax=Phanerochaete sordida TaxID=48140 RepID=A0A9P3LCJ5_9APHY|nr:hypothetical protein PsYK624_053750 [Phanerochaete sordida]